MLVNFPTRQSWLSLWLTSDWKRIRLCREWPCGCQQTQAEWMLRLPPLSFFSADSLQPAADAEAKGRFLFLCWTWHIEFNSAERVSIHGAKTHIPSPTLGSQWLCITPFLLVHVGGLPPAWGLPSTVQRRTKPYLGSHSCGLTTSHVPLTGSDTRHTACKPSWVGGVECDGSFGTTQHVFFPLNKN